MHLVIKTRGGKHVETKGGVHAYVCKEGGIIVDH